MGPLRKLRGERRQWWLPAFVLLSAALGCAAAPTLRWKSNPENPYRAWVEVSGLTDFSLPADPAQATALLQARIDHGSDASLPPMAGRLAFEGGVLRFHPTFPLEPGLRYTATFKGPVLLEASLRAPPRKPVAAPRVTKVDPTGDVLPLNLLKFYLHFSAPMTRGAAYQHIRLVDAAGKIIADPFLELPEELWNPEMTRLTVLLDPGRIKRGLLPNKLVGAVLEEGKRYRLVIDQQWKGASGQLLESSFSKEFRASAPDYTQPDPAKWRHRYPAAATRDPLRIVFAESLDAALATRLLSVRAGQKPLAGEIALAKNESAWEFRPDKPWSAGPYELLIDRRLEDRAGNSIERPFEEALDRLPDEVGKTPGLIRTPFTIGPAKQPGE